MTGAKHPQDIEKCTREQTTIPKALRTLGPFMRREFALQIWSGQKSIEARPRKHPCLQNISASDELVFHWCRDERLICTVLSVSYSSNMRDALTTMGFQRFLPLCIDLESACVAGTTVSVSFPMFAFTIWMISYYDHVMYCFLNLRLFTAPWGRSTREKWC